MNVLVIIGSPRKKNTFSMCRLIEEKVNATETVEFEYLFLGNMNLELCRGCMLCISKGEEYCPIKDDLQSIIEKMHKADITVFSSPVYVHHITSIMKNFIDRSCYHFHRPSFFDKTAFVVTTTASSGLEDTSEYLKRTVRGYGFNFIGSLDVMMVIHERSQKYRHQISMKIDDLSKKILQTMKYNKKPVPGIYNLVLFGIMKQVAPHIERDNTWWQEKGLFDKDYYIDVPIPFFNKLIANLILKKIKRKQAKYFR